ncbi:hypothetical protein BKA70DRAFT_1239545 [Coprinopsis sp. MPI-PUGE-AT-0042]|nr:hypothetical protein BKA70DRAFT_1239545 [Coprinopsis sp. MPI-PUGE-AT-0042]
MGRQWLHLKELKWFGFGHSDKAPGPGSLAMFCAGCPQPGINISAEDWKALTDVPKQQHADDDDVWLKKGYSFMTERHRYQSHLEVALESKQLGDRKNLEQKPNCHDHRAIADRWKGMKGCDATGIGSVALFGHSQMNIDYAFVQALQHSNVLRGTKIVLCYDVNCQYCINFQKRCQQSSALAEAQHYPITFAIGLWHVHGHRPECYPRHAPSFVYGAVRKSGEILESLWDTLNPITGCTRTMTNAHRVEVLDAVMADSNWKKLTGLVVSITRDVVRARIEAGASADEFDAIDTSISTEHRDLWTSQTAKAQRTRSKNPKSMDIFSSTMEAPPSRVRVELELMNTERASGHGKGIARWISLGIKIQEQHIVEFEKLGASLFPTLDFSSFTTDFVPLSDHLELDDDSDTEDEVHQSSFRPTTTQTRREPEYLAISLPSSINPLPTPMKDAAKTEIKLRIAQANNELEELRDQIGRLSFMYRGVLRPAKTKVAKTRANHLLAAANRKKRLHARLYNQAQWALTRLHAPLQVRTTYRLIVGADLAVSTAIAEPNASGQSTESLSWIWSVRLLGMEPVDQGRGDDAGPTGEVNDLLSTHLPPPQRSKHLNEIYRVNWMRAREKAARWDEEYAFLWHEMTWVPTFFESRSSAWTELTSRQHSLGLGHDAYAFKQAALWKSLATYARSTFQRLQSEVTADKSEVVFPEGDLAQEADVSWDEGLLERAKESHAICQNEPSSSSEAFMALLKDSSLSTYQSVIYYVSSRLCAILKYYTEHYDLILRDALFNRYYLNLLGEFNFATGVVGTGVTRWGADFLLPTVFKSCAILLVDHQVADRHLAHLAASAQPDGPDALLLHYEGDWWTDFPSKDRKSPMTSIAFQELWEMQRPMLNVPCFQIPPLATFALDLVMTKSLCQALATAEDLLRDIDGSISRVSTRGRDIEARIVHVAGQRQRIANVYHTAYKSSAPSLARDKDQQWSKFMMYSNFRIQTIIVECTEPTDENQLQH